MPEKQKEPELLLLFLLRSKRKRDTSWWSTLLCLLLTLEFHLPSSTTFSWTVWHMCRNRCTFKVWRWAEASAQSVLYILKWNIHVKDQINYWRWTLKSQRLWIQDLFNVNHCLINCYSELSWSRSCIFQADLLQEPPYLTIMFAIALSQWISFGDWRQVRLCSHSSVQVNYICMCT